MNEKKDSIQNKKIIIGVVLFCILCFVFVLVYKAQIAGKMNASVQCTLMSEHKDNDRVYLSDDMAVFSETFICQVPDLKEISVECEGTVINEHASLIMVLSDAQTGEEYYHKETLVSKAASKDKIKKVSMKLESVLKDSEGKLLTLSWQIVNGNGTILVLTSNMKQGIVDNVNGLKDNKTNIIYGMKYSNCKEFKLLYVILCIALLIFGMLCYWILIVKKASIEKAYIPIAFMLGVIFNFVIMAHGVPDEPWHIDTAYKYSNKIMFVEDTGTPNTIYKRLCDVEMGDMLANGLESNSYYQLMHHTVELPENKEMIEVSYTDAGHIVPAIVYFPAAIGISIGRLFGLSALLTISLGRIMNLITFILLSWLAIRMIPFGKNMLGMVTLLPISMQQAASASYDAVVHGMIILFIALCFKLSEADSIRKRAFLLLAVLTVFIAMAKSAVYLPVCLLLLMLRKKNKESKISKKKVILVIGVTVILISMILLKYLPTFTMLVGGTETGEDTTYTLGYLLKHPLNVLYLYWNTFMEAGDNHIRGLLGGRLSWLDIKINWSFLIILLIGLLLLVHVENDRYTGDRKNRILLAVSCGLTIILIMFSMLLGYTVVGASHIQGLQGRYYLVLLPLLLFLTCTQMIHVKKNQCNNILMTMMVTECIIVLQIVTLI